MMIFGIFLCFLGSSAFEMETSPKKFVENLKNDKKGDELARTIFGSMTEKKFLSLYDALIPVNDGPLDHLLDEAECKELLLNRFMEHDNHANDGLEEDNGSLVNFKYTTKMMYEKYVEEFKREPNLSGVAWIIHEKHRNQALHLEMILAFQGYKPVPEEDIPEWGLFDETTEWEWIINGNEDDIKAPFLTNEMNMLKTMVDLFKEMGDVRCRRVNSGNTWFDIKSIDFEVDESKHYLYL